MRWASALSTSPDTASAIREAAEPIRERLGRADLAFVFVSPHHGARWDELAGALADALPGAVVVGCSGGGVVGGGEEAERRVALSVTAATLPGVVLTPFHLFEEQVPRDDDALGDWVRLLGVDPADDPNFVLLPDPYTFDPGALLRGLDARYPSALKLGGLVSGGREPGSSALLHDGRLYREGLVGLAMHGDVGVDAVVAQGCRPVGPPMFVTRCAQNLILELDGRKVVDVLGEVFDALEPRDRQLFEHALHIGVQSRDQTEYHPGDFLIREVRGFHRESGGLAVGTLPKRWQVVQMHVRDARASSEELDALLLRWRREHPDTQPAGGLMFSCLGRGEGLYGRPNHDSDRIAHHLGPLPLGGFFCNGELGPVHGTTHVHGYTTVLGLFRGR